MHINLICAKVNSLFNSFIKGELDEKENQFVREHLALCVNCRYKYQKLKELLALFGNEYTPKTSRKNAELLENKEYEYCKQNLSAYCDNEMSFDESVKFKKYIIKTPKAREELKKLYKLRELLQNSYKNLTKKFNHDFSKIIVNQLYHKSAPFRLPSAREFAASLVLIVILFTILGVGTLMAKSINKTIAGKISHYSHKVR